MGPHKRCIVVGGRTHQKYIDQGLMTQSGTIKEVVREAVIAQKSPVKQASPKRKLSPKKRGRKPKAKSPSQQFAMVANKARAERELQKIHKKYSKEKAARKAATPKKQSSPKKQASPKKQSPKKQIKRASPKKRGRPAKPKY
jgi:hypothetical protein